MRIIDFSCGDVGFEPMPEIERTHDGVDDGAYYEDDGDDGEGGERFGGRGVGGFVGGFVDADEFEDEVGEGAEVEGLDITGGEVLVESSFILR